MPLAAQVACTPVVAAISGEVSLVAVAANLLAAPAVAPATVLGLAGGLLGLLWRPLGVVVAAPAAWSAEWIITVAERGADLPTAAVTWGTSPPALLLLTGLCLLLVLLAPRLLGRPSTGAGLHRCCWSRVCWCGCPVRAGRRTGGCSRCATSARATDSSSGPARARRVVVDAGPDPALMDRLPRPARTSPASPWWCSPTSTPTTSTGWPGSLQGRRVGEVDASSLLEPPGGVREVAAVLGADPGVPSYGVTRQRG